MARTNYARGRNFEYKVVNRLKHEGFPIAQRSAGSHSPIDVWSIDFEKRRITLVQCKSGKSKKSENARAKKWLEATNGKPLEKLRGYYWVEIEFA